MTNSKEDFRSALVDAIRNASVSPIPVMILIENESSQKRLDIQNGSILNLDSTVVGEKFAALLVMMKVINKDDLINIVNPSLRNWELDNELIRRFNISKDKILKIFSIQISRIAIALNTWETGNIQCRPLKEKVALYQKPVLPVEEFLLHLFRDKVPSATIEKVSTSSHLPFDVSSERLKFLKTLPLSSFESQVAGLLFSEQSLDDILKISGIDRKKLFTVFSMFLELDFISFKQSTITEPSLIGSTPSCVPSIESKLEEMTDFLAKIENVSFYSIFGFSKENFSLTELRTSYHSLSKNYHPDRYRYMDCADLNRVLENIMNIVNEAYKTLSDPDLKEQYDTSLHESTISSGVYGHSASKPSISPQKQAEAQFSNAKSLLSASKFAESISYLRRCVVLVPDNSEYHAFLGYAYSKLSSHKKDAEHHFLESIKLCPMNVNTYLHLGLMYVSTRQFSKATQVFEEALSWDPENKIALRELEKIRGNKGGAGRFFSGIFKR